jgi:hypothetical protein
VATATSTAALPIAAEFPSIIELAAASTAERASDNALDISGRLSTPVNRDIMI